MDPRFTQAQETDQVNRFITFIQETAHPRADEIRKSADEQYNTQLGARIKELEVAVDKEHKKLLKEAALDEKISTSKIGNEARLQVLKAQQEMLDGLFEEARSKLSVVISDKGKYEKTLTKLIIQGMDALNEPALVIRARKVDEGVAKKAMSAAQKQYASSNGQDVTLTLDDSHLPASSLGGVVILGGGGKISVNNTLEARLEIIKEEKLHTIRTTLLGRNENCKFKD